MDINVNVKIEASKELTELLEKVASGIMAAITPCHCADKAEAPAADEAESTPPEPAKKVRKSRKKEEAPEIELAPQIVEQAPAETAPAPTTEAAPAPEVKAEDLLGDEAPASAEKPLTKEEVRKICADAMKADPSKKGKLAEALQACGGKSLSDVPEGNYAKLVEMVKAL